jgi:transposase-like protein
MAADGKYSSFLQALQGEAEQDVLRAMVRVVIQELMHEEVAQHLGAEPHERTRSRKGHRNGYKPRTLNTRLGKLGFEVPQVRGTEPYQPMFFERWQRSERALLATCAEMYFMGVSTRKVGRVLEEMGGFSLSAATVSKVAAELDEKLEEFRSRALGNRTWPFLIVDARYEKVRHAGRIVSRAVLVVAGVNDEGHREILTWRLGDSESEQTWAEVFGELRRRGLSDVELIVSDGHEGIRAALGRAFPQAAWQRCRIHFIRNIMNKCSHKDRIVLINVIRAAFKLTDRTLALQTARELAVRWGRKYPKVARQIEEQFEECLAVLEFPTRHRRRLHSTNMLERLMREIKRRTRVVGIFPNEASCDWLVGAMLIEYHEAWQCQRARFIRMEEY